MLRRYVRLAALIIALVPPLDPIDLKNVRTAGKPKTTSSAMAAITTTSSINERPDCLVFAFIFLPAGYIISRTEFLVRPG